MASDLTDEEISYLLKVSAKRWNDDVPFRLDRISLGLVEKGLLELDLTHYLSKWCLTTAGERAVEKRSSGT